MKSSFSLMALCAMASAMRMKGQEPRDQLRNKFKYPTMYHGEPITPLQPTPTTGNVVSRCSEPALGGQHTEGAIPTTLVTQTAATSISRRERDSNLRGNYASDIFPSTTSIPSFQSSQQHPPSRRGFSGGVVGGVVGFMAAWNRFHTSSDSPVDTRQASLDGVYRSEHCNVEQFKSYIYFTVIHPNGTAWNPDNAVYHSPEQKASSPLLYVETPWRIQHANALRKAILNDPQASDACTKGHCLSTPIPGTDGLRLQHVSNASDWRGDVETTTGHRDDHCFYKPLLGISRLGVHLADAGSLATGSQPDMSISSFVYSRVHSTYPGVEIGLILSFTVGIVVLVVLLPCMHCICKLLACLGRLLMCAICAPLMLFRAPEAGREHTEWHANASVTANTDVGWNERSVGMGGYMGTRPTGDVEMQLPTYEQAVNERAK